MAEFSRTTTTTWTGNLLEGNGVTDAGTGAFHLPVTFAQRVGEPAGHTSPEELVAAAHGTCYAMVMSNTIAKKNASAQKITVACTVTADKGEAGIKIVRSELALTAYGLVGMDAATFDAVAKEAEGKCPVSGALRGSLTISVTTAVK